MRWTAAALLLLVGACSKDGPMPLDIAQNKQMIWDQIKKYHEALDKDDLDIIGTLLTPDVSMVVGNDEVARGKDAVMRALRDRIKEWAGAKRSTIFGKEVIKPDGNIALVTYIARAETKGGIITMICSRNKDNLWLISHIHDTWSTTAKK